MPAKATPRHTVREWAKKAADGTGIPRYFVHQVAFEARMLRIRLAAPFRRRRIRALEKSSPLRLIFGCGTTRYPGWTGVDCFRNPSVDLLLDLRRPLPFHDASVEYCYSEHFLEHLHPPEALAHLREVHRVLKPGGVYRIVVPAGMRFAKKYLEGDSQFFALAHPWEARPFDAMYKILNWGGEHRGIYDFAQLQHVAQTAGFAQVRECQANQSPLPLLRIDRSEPQRVAESLYVEAAKAGPLD
jgi:predicted SAM-dependent methyltransferase